MKYSLLLISFVTSQAFGQAPDYAIKANLSLVSLAELGGKTRIRWVDARGNYSTVGVSLNLEPGYYVLVTERLQRFDKDCDPSQIDEAFIEDPGLWRIGKQYLPFGARNLIRESALGARYDMKLPIVRLPLRIAAFDNGNQHLQGAMARLGSQIGVSLFIGNNLAAAGTSLGTIRDIESAPGKGRGYRVGLGADYLTTIGKLEFHAEALILRRPNHPGDRSEDFTDLSLEYRAPAGPVRTRVGWTRSWRQRDDYFYVQNEVQMTKFVSLVGFIRFNGSDFRVLSLGIHFKL